MNVLFLCTDNYTRSVIAEFCAKDYLKTNHITDITVASAGIRASSDISSYSDLHFQVMRDMDIDVSQFKRTQFGERSFEDYDFIIGMSELHRDFVRKEYNRDIYLFNEVYKSQNTPVNIGAPDEEGFDQKMRELIQYFNNAIPVVIKNIKNYQN
ncbi:hypothetical protein PV403_12235 [Paenibacillus sp. GYB006]|uniref:arsenate reductase/protein-tyrosine-phosphatase family protein n=1 Tax=unclassified Paenibacillus TaxID=185978 RepID=UPI001BCFFA11|nr:hypothetical protein [Paenibacillus sp. J45TS6]